MKAGYKIIHNKKNDSLGETYKFASCSNLPNHNEVFISYWTEHQELPNHNFIVAIFKIKPKCSAKKSS